MHYLQVLGNFQTFEDMEDEFQRTGFGQVEANPDSNQLFVKTLHPQKVRAIAKKHDAVNVIALNAWPFKF